MTVGWADTTDDGTGVARSRTSRASGTWTPVTTAAGIDEAVIASAASGEQVAVGLHDGDYVSEHRPAATATWSPATTVWSPTGAFGSAATTSVALEGPPDLTAAGDGTMASSWTFAVGTPSATGIAGANALLVSTRSAAGAWGTPTVLDTVTDVAFKCRHQVLVDSRDRYTVVAVLPTTPGKADVVAWTSAAGGAGPWARSTVLRGVARSDAFVSSVDPSTGRTVVLVQRPGRTRGVARLSAVSRRGADAAWGRPVLVTRSAARDEAGTTFSGGTFSERYDFRALVGPRGVTVAATTASGRLLTTRLP